VCHNTSCFSLCAHRFCTRTRSPGRPQWWVKSWGVAQSRRQTNATERTSNESHGPPLPRTSTVLARVSGVHQVSQVCQWRATALQVSVYGGKRRTLCTGVLVYEGSGSKSRRASGVPLWWRSQWDQTGTAHRSAQSPPVAPQVVVPVLPIELILLSLPGPIVQGSRAPAHRGHQGMWGTD